MWFKENLQTSKPPNLKLPNLKTSKPETSKPETFQTLKPEKLVAHSILCALP
jgi:hypothetical protein